MTTEGVEVYSGPDWETERLTLARAFNLLDQMSDYAVPGPREEAVELQSRLDVIADLAGHLEGEVTIASIELGPLLMSTLGDNQPIVEAKARINRLRAGAAGEDESDVDQLGEALARARHDVERLRDVFKAMDQ